MRVLFRNLSFLLPLTVLWSFQPAAAQKVEILAQTEFRSPALSKSFIFWEAATDTAALQPVATLRVTGIGSDDQLEPLFDQLRTKAQGLGANAFRPVGFVAEAHKTSLTLACYYAPEEAVEANIQHQERNVIYIFGRLHRSGKGMAFKLNDAPQEVASGTFFRYPFAAGQDVKISKGGAAGTTARLTAQAGEPALFLSLSGFSAAPAVIGGVSAMAVSAGGLAPMNRSLGRMLVTLLQAGGEPK